MLLERHNGPRFLAVGAVFGLFLLRSLARHTDCCCLYNRSERGCADETAVSDGVQKAIESERDKTRWQQRSRRLE